MPVKLPESSVKPGFLYRLYQARLRKQINPARVPAHIAVIVDGNRRWAKQRLQEQASVGHRAGARKIPEFLRWAETAGVGTVTMYLLSADNLASRNSAELDELFGIIADLAGVLAAEGNWRVQHVGDAAVLPVSLAEALVGSEEATKLHDGLQVNLAVGYGGRSEITQAVRGAIAAHEAAGGGIETLAEALTPELIAEHLWTKGQPDPDLVIRTSGEQRLSDFMIWQAAHSEFYFVDTLYPDIREVDLLRAIRDYSQRQRRFGG